MDKIYNLTKRLVEMQTTEDKPEEIEKCLKIIEKEFSQDFYIKKFNYRNRPIIVLSNTRIKKVDLIFAGHVDVVPAKSKDFKLVEKGSKLFARGIYDMKAPLATLLLAVKEYLKQSSKLKIAIFITADEEIDGLSTKYLIKEKGYKAKFAILPDGGSEKEIVVEQKGFWQIKITIKGKGAHASRPWKAENPISEGLVLYNNLLKKFPLPKNENNWRTTISLTRVMAGKSINQIPTEAEFYFDIRYIKNRDKDKIISHMEKYSRQDLKVDIIAENGLLQVKQNNSYLKILKRVMEKELKKEVELVRECGTSDAVFFTENKIPAVLFTLKGDGAHGEDEWVNKRSLGKYYKVVLNFLSELDKF
ncbi:MAG: M20/M25/M40 family metallo-hydrolase [Patescibacteria group bacterium]